MIQTQPAEAADFSGGIVDDYTNGRPNQAQIFNNVIPLEDKSLLMRPGSEVREPTYGQIPVGIQKIRTLINFRDSEKLLVHSAKRIYYRNPSAYTTLSGPTGNDVFSTADVDSVVSHTQWKGMLYLVNNDFAKPQRVYKNELGVIQLRSAGLPSLAVVHEPRAGGA